MSLSADLCLGAVDQIVSELGLDERCGADGGPYLSLHSPMSPAPVGVVRRYHGAVDLVYVALTVEPIGLDSHMMFAFTPAVSAVPHFTVDSVHTAEAYAFHLDLIPRLDLGAHLAYMDHCFEPLTQTREHALEIEGLTPAALSPRQWALMSEWMLANRATEPAFAQVSEVVAAYLRHWLGLMASGVPAEVCGGNTESERVQRDRANRAAIFNPDVDKVWANVTRLVGEEQSEAVRSLLVRGGRDDESAE